MALEIRLPELGENISSGDVIRVMVKPGDRLRKDQPVLELETGKATLEVPSPAAGAVAQVHVRDGGKVKVGDLILTLDESGAAAAAPEAKAKPAPAPAAAKPPCRSS